MAGIGLTVGVLSNPFYMYKNKGVIVLAQEISEAQKNQNAYDVGIHMRNQGWNFTAICALLGNMDVESGINPDMEQIGSGIGFGLVQFDGSAYPLVGPQTTVGRNYVKTLCRHFLGSDQGYNTVLKQCQLIDRVMYGGQYIPTRAYPQSADEFKKWTGNVTDAVYAFLRNFERAGTEHAERRVAAAKAWEANLKLDDAPPADKNPVTPTTPSNPQGGESKEEVDKVTGHWVEKVETKKWSLDEGYYYMRNGVLYDASGKSSFKMTRFGDTMLLGLDTETKKEWVEDEIKEEIENNSSKPSPSPPQPEPDSGKPPVTGGDVIANTFIHELNLVVNHKPHVYYYNGRPQPDPTKCGWADCSGFIGWGLRNIHPAVWNGGSIHTGTIHTILKNNGYMIWGVGARTDIPWDKLKPGDIINFGMDASLGAGLQSHVICYGHNGQIIDCNGSGGAQIRDNCKNIVMNYYNHSHAAVYRIYK